MGSSLPTKYAPVLCLALIGILGVCYPVSQAFGQPANSDSAESVSGDADVDRMGYLVRIPLPIDSNVSAKVRQTLKQLSERPNLSARPQDRPVVVLEFDTSDGRTGQGSELEACMALARYLSDSDLSRLATVAYVPASRTISEPQNENLTGQLSGHAVLVAIAANRIALDPGVAIGKAGIDEDQVRPLFREVYRSVAAQRLTLPIPVVMSMLDKELRLFRVTRPDRGVTYANDEELKEIEDSGIAHRTTTVSQRGEFTFLTGQQLNEMGLLDLIPSSRTELARMLDLAPNSLEGDPVQGGRWRAVELELPPVIDARTKKWIVSTLRQQVAKQKVNLIILKFEDNVGDLDACIGLSQHLVEYSPDDVRTVAFVRDQARGPIGLVAMSCSHLVMAKDAVLGGLDESETPLDRDELNKLRPQIKSIAAEKQADWSIMMQMLDPNLVVTRYRHKTTGQMRLMSNEEFESSGELDAWAPLGPIGGLAGIDASQAKQFFLARTIADNMDQLQTFYQLDEAPESIRPSASDRWIERLAGFLSSPFVSPWLLFAAMFFLSTEMSAPGLGIPGFLGALCFVLFFWSQSLDGNADWLEIIMFVVGVVFIIMEIFVLPGFGVFGLGGIILVVSSLILASQSFLIPRSSDDMVQMTYSLVPLIGAGMGTIVAGIALRKIIPHSPYLRRMILVPRQQVDTGLGGRTDPEAVVDWSYLNGQSGETITRLNPSGKARIAGRVYDVISKGQMVDKSTPIVVIEAVGNRVVVRTEESTE